MSDLQSEMNRVVAGFVSQITDLARRAAIDQLEGVFNMGKRGKSPLGARARRKGSKRTGGELDKLAESFHAFVAKHPGLRIEQINKQLGTTTKDLALPIRKLISDGSLKTKGAKRSTTYFPGAKKN